MNLKNDAIEVVMLDVLRPEFTKWLEGRGLTLMRIPPEPEGDPDALSMYCVGVGEPLMRLMKNIEDSQLGAHSEIAAEK